MSERLKRCSSLPYRGDPVYWYWYRRGQGALIQRDCRADRSIPADAPEARSSAFYAFMDGYHVRHGFR